MIDIKSLGAKGDGVTNDTLCVQKAIDECADQRKMLFISKGTYKVGSIQLRSNTHIVFEEGAVLSGIENVAAYCTNDAMFVDAVGGLRGKALVIIYKAQNVTIEGKGVITGNGPNVQIENDKPFLVRIAESKNVAIRDVKLMNSISWCVHVFKSQDVTMEYIKVYNRGCPNNDGFDIDSSQKVTIRSCDLSCGDDAICIKTTSNMPTNNVYVSDCRISSDWAAFKIGTESVGNISNILVEDCEFHDVVGGGIKIVPTDGASVDTVKIKNIVMRNCTGPIFIANGERNREYAGEKSEQLSCIKNVEIDGIEADVVPAPFRGYYDGEEWGNALGGVILSGTVMNKVENIRLSNMKLLLPGGFQGQIPHQVREMEAMYPEFHRFDPVPAKGIYIRHARNISYEKIEISYKKEDVRQEIYMEDVEGEERL